MRFLRTAFQLIVLSACTSTMVLPLFLALTCSFWFILLVGPGALFTFLTCQAMSFVWADLFD
jgi:hypothetical protein